MLQIGKHLECNMHVNVSSQFMNQNPTLSGHLDYIYLAPLFFAFDSGFLVSFLVLPLSPLYALGYIGDIPDECVCCQVHSFKLGYHVPSATLNTY
jgi:hypothetical protein